MFRSQLPRKNDFYPYDPPPDEEPAAGADDERVLGSGVKLCRLCGCAGHKACSRCHKVTYCCKEHQAIDWKQQHKRECSSESKYWKMVPYTMNSYTVSVVYKENHYNEAFGFFLSNILTSSFHYFWCCKSTFVSWVGVGNRTWRTPSKWWQATWL